ncbi:MAG: response regulator transcription factor [Acidobacteria bacterium]|nr:response regulator transcription factor [Acidobacteriota bacterium]
MRAGIATVVADTGVDVLHDTREAKEALFFAEEDDVDVVILGVTNDLSPREAVRRAKALRNIPKIVLLLAGGELHHLAQLISGGCDALLLRSTSEPDLANAVGGVLRGERYVDPALVPVLSGSITTTADTNGGLLTGRERDVLAALAKGRSNRAIAEDLFLAPETVKSHLSRVYTKLGVSGRNEAVARAVALGLLG